MVEEDGIGWKRMEEDGREWKRMEDEDYIDDRCPCMVDMNENICLCPAAGIMEVIKTVHWSNMSSWQ